MGACDNRKKDCEVVQLIETAQDSMKAKDNKTQIDEIPLNFVKAFDRVPNKRLLSHKYRSRRVNLSLNPNKIDTKGFLTDSGRICHVK